MYDLAVTTFLGVFQAFVVWGKEIMYIKTEPFIGTFFQTFIKICQTTEVSPFGLPIFKRLGATSRVNLELWNFGSWPPIPSRRRKSVGRNENFKSAR